MKLGNRWRLPCLLLVTASAVGATDYLLDPHSQRLSAWACGGIFLAAWTTVVVSWRTHRRYLRCRSGGAALGVLLLEVIAVSHIYFNFFACSLRPNTPEEQQFVALTTAIKDNDLGRVQSVLAHDKNPDFVPLHDSVTEASSDYRDAYRPLETATLGGHVEIAEALLDHGASLTQGNPNPLALAAKNGEIPMMRMLIAKGAPVNDFGGENINEKPAGALASASGVPMWEVYKSSSALWYAVQEEKADSVAFLLAHGANPCTSKDDLGYANVMRLARYTGNIPIAKMLKKAGAVE